MEHSYYFRLKAVQDWVYDNITDVDEFCSMFDITVEDMVKCFPDAQVKAFKKVFPPDVDDNLEDENENEAWNGYSIKEDEE